MDAGTFALVPLEVVQDKRLTLWQIRVLVALFSFRNKNTDTVWPSRAAISERSGMHPSNISAATSALVELGWLKKEGVGGNSKASRYTITVPDLDTVAESTTVVQSTTVAAPATTTVAESTTTTVAAPATRIEQTKEQTKEQTNKAPRKAAPLSCPSGVDEQVWQDFLAHRKAKRSPLTATALAGIEREASKAGYSLEDALMTCCSRGWVGFKADWVDDRPQQAAAPAESFRERDLRLARERWEQATGQRHPDSVRNDRQVIDITPAASTFPAIPF